MKGRRGGDVRLKSETMRTRWIPGVNNLGQFGRWAFVEFGDVYDMDKEFRAVVAEAIGEAGKG